VTLLALLAGLCLPIVGCSSNATVSEDIVARVNGKEITTADLEKAYQGRINGAPQSPTPEEAQALKFQLITQMINDEILLQMASASGLNATDAEVETKFTDLKSQYTEEQFQGMLKAQKMTADDIKAEMRKGLTVEKLITKEITQRINVSEGKSGPLRKNRASFNLPEQYRCSTSWLLLPGTAGRKREADDARSRKTPKPSGSVVPRYLGGKDFGVVARDWSEGRSRPPMERPWVSVPCASRRDRRNCLRLSSA
jgi:peptidyl-prolyl cis-trans isomerase SurA